LAEKIYVDQLIIYIKNHLGRFIWSLSADYWTKFTDLFWREI